MKTTLFIAILAIAPALHAAELSPRHQPLQPAAPNAGDQLTDAEVRGRITAFLGSIDTRITANQWAALGARAEPILEGIARDTQQFSVRRAAALDGLAAGKWTGATQVFHDLAHDETCASNVRFHAVRGLGAALTASKRSAELGSLLEGAKDSRVRAVAAEQLTKNNSKSGCAAFQKQLAREDEAVRGQFHTAAVACGVVAGK